jgi:hypothetical protein
MEEAGKSVRSTTTNMLKNQQERALKGKERALTNTQIEDTVIPSQKSVSKIRGQSLA